MMKKMRMGIIGTGLAFEKLHYPAYQELQDHFELVALADREIEKARYWANKLQISPENVYADYRQLLNRADLDGVDIMVPIELNFEVTEAAARAFAGSNRIILCEKPLAPTLEQAEAFMELPRKYRVAINIAENYRYNEEYQIIRELVQSKRIGEIHYFLQNRVNCFLCDLTEGAFPTTEWRQHPEYPGGAILDTAIHDVAGLHHIFGPVEEVFAHGRMQNYDFSPYSVVTANLRFASGVIGIFSFFTAGKEMQRPLTGLRIFGDQGMIYLEERDCQTVNVAFNDGTSTQIPYRAQRGYYNELLNVYNAWLGTEQLAVPPEIEFGDAKLVFAILESIRSGQPVKVDTHLLVHSV